MLQPEANDFFIRWAQLAPGIISYAKQKALNPDVQSLLSELSNGGQAESAGDGYTPPQCTLCYCLFIYALLTEFISEHFCLSC